MLRPVALFFPLLFSVAAAAPPLSLLRRAAAAGAAGATPNTGTQWPMELQNLTWTSERGAILLNGQQFHLKGVNWFGMETADTR